MKNKWKLGFWILMVIFISTTTFLVYQIVDQAVTLTYLRDSDKGTESDLKEFSQIIKGKLDFKDFKQISDRYPDLTDSTYLGMQNLKITFGPDLKITSVTTQW